MVDDQKESKTQTEGSSERTETHETDHDQRLAPPPAVGRSRMPEFRSSLFRDINPDDPDWLKEKKQSWNLKVLTGGWES